MAKKSNTLLWVVGGIALLAIGWWSGILPHLFNQTHNSALPQWGAIHS